RRARVALHDEGRRGCGDGRRGARAVEAAPVAAPRVGAAREVRSRTQLRLDAAVVGRALRAVVRRLGAADRVDRSHDGDAGVLAVVERAAGAVGRRRRIEDVAGVALELEDVVAAAVAFRVAVDADGDR